MAQARDAETRRQREVMDHSDTIRKLNSTEAAAEAAHASLKEAQAAAEAAVAAQVWCLLYCVIRCQQLTSCLHHPCFDRAVRLGGEPESGLSAQKH